MKHRPGDHPAKGPRRVGVVEEDGRVAAFVVTMVTGIFAVIGLTLDGGLALAAKVEARGQAEAAARAGAQAIDLATYRATGDVRLIPAQAIREANSYLTRSSATGTVSANDESVTVTVTTTYKTQMLGLVGIRVLRVDATASARPQPGITRPEP